MTVEYGRRLTLVIPGLDPGIQWCRLREWMPGTSPGMTECNWEGAARALNPEPAHQLGDVALQGRLGFGIEDAALRIRFTGT